MIAGLLLFLLTLLFPLFLYFIGILTNCSGVGGACGAVGAVAGIYVKLPLTFLILLMIGWTAMRRIARLYLPRIWFLVAALLLLSAFGPLAAFGNFWGANFAIGMIYVSFMPVLFLASLLVFLGVLPAELIRRFSRPEDPILLVGAAIAIHAAALMLFLNPLLGLIGLHELSFTIFRVATLGGLLSPNWLLPLELLAFVATLVMAATIRRGQMSSANLL